MKQLEHLRETADRSLAGLEATPQLRHRIEEAVTASGQPAHRRSWRPAYALAIAAVLALVVAVPLLRGQQAIIPAIREQAAGSDSQHEGEAKLISRGQVAVTSLAKAGEGSLWADGAGSDFPVVGINGRYYRLMTYALPGSATRGTQLGTVETLTDTPMYASGVVSNLLPEGTAICAVSGMDGAMVTAEVDGTAHVFQRVSMNQMGLASGEQMEATLCAAGKVVSMTLSGVGTVSDPAACAKLYALLTDSATLEGTGPFTGQQTLHLTLNNGLVLQLAVRGDRFSSCGVWNCPGFAEAFAEAVK